MNGFLFGETMSGTWAPPNEPADNRRFTFTIEARADSFATHLRNGKTRMQGTLYADGLAEHAAIEGTLTMLPFRRRIIRYEFDFTGDDGKPYRFEGQKDIRLLNPFSSFTVLPGLVLDSDGRTVGNVLTHFDLKADLFQFLASWRPV